jgi:PAS domain S-box-containing protein
MRALPAGTGRQYTAALRHYLAGGGEAARAGVGEAARLVLAECGLRGLVAAHREALDSALRSAAAAERSHILERALSCLAEDISLDGRQPAAPPWPGLGGLESVEDQLRRQNEELVAAHRTVERERSRYQALFDFAPDAYLVTGMEGAIWEANAAAAALLRTPKELLPGQSLHEFVAEADRVEFRGRLRALHAGSIERIEDWEIGIVPRHAPPKPAALTVVAERSLPATVAGLRWLLRDVTERRRLESERTGWLVSRAKAKAARRFEFLAEASALLVGPLNVEASLASVARLAASFLRAWCFISVVELDGSLRQLEAAHADPEDEQLAKQLRAHCLFGGKTESLPAGPLEVEPLTAGWCDRAADSAGHARMLRQIGGRGATILPLRIRERLVGVLAVVRTFDSRPYHEANRALQEDLARRCALALENARLYREVVAQRDKAEKASRAKDEFVAILGHELRNPLTPIAGWTRVLKGHSAIAQNPTLAEGVRAMEKNARALGRLVNECTDLARISEGKFQVERTPVDMNQVVSVAADAARIMAAERGLTLELEFAPQPLAVMGDAMRLEQVVANLLINAVKYTDSPGRITVRTAAESECAAIEVADTGIGIEQSYLEMIFEPFRQGAASWLTSRSGLGLGLSIARRIVELHGGRIWAESGGLGAGSAFRVSLPRTTAAPPPRTPDPPAPRPPSRARAVRILLVEDSADILFLLKTGLENMGHTVVTATDGLAAMEIARAGRPGLLISDIKMPLMDGYELIRSLRREPRLRHTPAIALTGFGSRTEIERALAAGFDACLTKPAEPEQIATTIRELVERRG